jgi:hypothetical protein
VRAVAGGVTLVAGAVVTLSRVAVWGVPREVERVDIAGWVGMYPPVGGFGAPGMLGDDMKSSSKVGCGGPGMVFKCLECSANPRLEY